MNHTRCCVAEMGAKQGTENVSERPEMRIGPLTTCREPRVGFPEIIGASIESRLPTMSSTRERCSVATLVSPSVVPTAVHPMLRTSWCTATFTLGPFEAASSAKRVWGLHSAGPVPVSGLEHAELAIKRALTTIGSLGPVCISIFLSNGEPRSLFSLHQRTVSRIVPAAAAM
jgi:hypothetical protein